MKAIPVLKAKEIREDGTIVEVVVWKLPARLEPCTHSYKYRLYYGLPGVCRVRYDNELGKGDHRHINGHEFPYRFRDLETLLTDFQHDIEAWGTAHESDH
ncbi:MAG TPA: DUF6516 family protein [Limnobacter sp.]|uniref:toxin-antitoxin system TumE family protein n=1 Tax=Limnobacter sp. TaxID=2003368 RepID=UPI002ED7F8D9